jgi:diacylglycerol kinase (ATP)
MKSQRNEAPDFRAEFPRRVGINRIYHATFYSIAGIRAAWKGEAAFRQEVLLAAILVPSAFWVGTSPVEQVLLAGSVVLVLIVELLNSAIEAVVNRISMEHHPLSKEAKDMGSAAILVCLLLVVGVWALFISQRLWG